MTKGEKYAAMLRWIDPAKNTVREKKEALETLNKLLEETGAAFQAADGELQAATDSYNRQVADESWKHPDDDYGEYAQSQYLSYKQECDAAKAVVDSKQAVWEAAKAALEDAQKKAEVAKQELDEAEAELQKLMDEVESE